MLYSGTSTPELQKEKEPMMSEINLASGTEHRHEHHVCLRTKELSGHTAVDIDF